MENASEALMMAFGVLILVIALTVSMVSFNRVKNVSDIVLFTSDKTNYYEYTGETGKANENRIVGIETIIPTLYRYYDENYTVLFRQANYNKETGEFSDINPLKVYTSETNEKNWPSYYKTTMEYKYKTLGFSIMDLNNFVDRKEIFSFDLDEEILRHEPWTGSNTNRNKEVMTNLNAFLSGEKYYRPSDNSEISYAQGFIEKHKKDKFVETIYEYTYNNDTEEGNETNIQKEKKKRIIIFTKINNQNAEEE